MTADEKQKILTQRFGEGGYDYIGNDSKDLQALCHARKAYLVTPTKKLYNKKKSLPDVEILVSKKIHQLVPIWPKCVCTNG